jgi:nucleoside-diphosphate-sugar epimerase
LDDYDKIPLEAAVRELSSSWTVLRLPMVYGPGDRQRRFRWAIAPMLTGKDRLVIPTRWANWQSTYGFIDNVGAAIASTLGNKRAFNQVFNVADETQTNQIEWANKFAEVIGWRGSIELTDDPDDPFQTQLANLDLDVPFKIDSGKLRRRLGISDMVSESAALEKTVASESSI